jgi:hypothetical protein
MAPLAVSLHHIQLRTRESRELSPLPELRVGDPMSALLQSDYLHGWFFEAVAGRPDAHAGRSSDRLPVGTSLFRKFLYDWGPGQQGNLSLNALSRPVAIRRKVQRMAASCGTSQPSVMPTCYGAA